jgi:hypothetical protein
MTTTAGKVTPTKASLAFVKAAAAELFTFAMSVYAGISGNADVVPARLAQGTAAKAGAAVLKMKAVTKYAEGLLHIQVKWTGGHGRLSDLDKVAVRIAHVAPQLGSMDFRLGDKCRAHTEGSGGKGVSPR